MVGFVCDWCGKCCRSFGEFIRIERQLTERDYYCRYGITNDLFLVHVLPQFADEISEEFAETVQESGAKEKKCIFSRKNPDGDGSACAIYPTRPAVCREFRCYRMLIRNCDGDIVGKVFGKNVLRTSDQDLAALWKVHVSPLQQASLPQESDPVWMANVNSILTRHGYCAETVT
jgi:uncharacterized protein